MTHPGEPSDHAGHGTSQAPLPYSPEEWKSFRASDKVAGAYIVGLMGGIFSIGLVLYLIVLWSVVS
jgi:hypothetical protein